MNELYKALDEKDGAIEALKDSNQERQKIIDELIAEGVKKDNKIKLLELQRKMLVKSIKLSRGK